MAKSARSSRVKANKTRLRETIFKPANEARTVRLSERLLAAANARKAAAMEVEAEKSANAEEQMDIDEKVTGFGVGKKKILAAKVKKRQSSRHAVVFQGLSKGRKKKSRGGE